ncbi:DsbA family protein [Natronorarus salvus]|uniref:DsbA family protein n=1 Tax=Natronorarus salvus TaxID=3117733 RepID=UPI002F264254
MPGRREVLLSAMAVGCLAGCLDDDAGDVDGGEQGDGVSDDDTPGSDDDPGATGSDSDDTSEPEGADDGRGDESEEGETADGGEEGSDETENTPRDHPLAADLGSLPTRGDPATATATIVDVSDVSCPLCREFHQGAYEELSSAYIDGGELAYVYRAIPGLDTGWNVPATHALYETLEREGEAAFWSLAEFYYREQDGLDEGNVIERTEEFLHRIVEEPDAVVEAAEIETHTGMIENTIAAAREAGIEGVPTFYLFREGEYLTTIEGNQSAEVFENALSL